MGWRMYKRYEVIGQRQYRSHKHGTIFDAQLDPLAERRAVERGAIRVLEIVHPGLQDGSYTIPENWLEASKQEQ